MSAPNCLSQLHIPCFNRFYSITKKLRQIGVVRMALHALQVLAALDTRDDPDAEQYYFGATAGGTPAATNERLYTCFYGAASRIAADTKAGPARAAPAALRHSGHQTDAWRANALHAGAQCTSFFSRSFDTPEAFLVWAKSRAARNKMGLLECLFLRVSQRSAAMVAAWMAAGFVHGVMNTDNMFVRRAAVRVSTRPTDASSTHRVLLVLVQPGRCLVSQST